MPRWPIAWVLFGVIAAAGCGDDGPVDEAIEFDDPAPDNPLLAPTVTLMAIFDAADQDDTITVTITPVTDGEVVVGHESEFLGDPDTWLLSPTRSYVVETTAPGYQTITRVITTGDGGTTIDLGTIPLTQGVRLGTEQNLLTGGTSDPYALPQVVDPATGTLIVGTRESWLRIRDVGTGPLEIVELADLPIEGTTPRFSPDGTTLFLSTYDGLTALDTTTWERFTGDVGLIDTTELVFAAPGTRIAASNTLAFSWDAHTLVTLVEFAGEGQYEALSGDGTLLERAESNQQAFYELSTGTRYTFEPLQGTVTLSNDGGHIFHGRNTSGANCPGLFSSMQTYQCTLALDYTVIGTNIRMVGVSPTSPHAVVLERVNLVHSLALVDFGVFPRTYTQITSPTMSNKLADAVTVGDLVIVQDQRTKIIQIDPDTTTEVPHDPAAHAIDIRTGLVHAEIPGTFTFHPRSDGSVLLREVFPYDDGEPLPCRIEWLPPAPCERRLVVISPDGELVETIELTEGIPFGPDRASALTVDSYDQYLPGAGLEQTAWLVDTLGVRRTVARVDGLGALDELAFGPITGDTSPLILDAPCLVYSRLELVNSLARTRGVYCVR